jgi:hypothetical protein
MAPLLTLGSAAISLSISTKRDQVARVMGTFRTLMGGCRWPPGTVDLAAAVAALGVRRV